MCVSIFYSKNLNSESMFDQYVRTWRNTVDVYFQKLVEWKTIAGFNQ